MCMIYRPLFGVRKAAGVLGLHVIMQAVQQHTFFVDINTPSQLEGITYVIKFALQNFESSPKISRRMHRGESYNRYHILHQYNVPYQRSTLGDASLCIARKTKTKKRLRVVALPRKKQTSHTTNTYIPGIYIMCSRTHFGLRALQHSAHS